MKCTKRVKRSAPSGFLRSAADRLTARALMAFGAPLKSPSRYRSWLAHLTPGSRAMLSALGDVVLACVLVVLLMAAVFLGLWRTADQAPSPFEQAAVLAAVAGVLLYFARAGRAFYQACALLSEEESDLD